MNMFVVKEVYDNCFFFFLSLQEFYPETNSDGGQNNPDDVSNTSETSPIKKVSEDKYLESSFAEKPSQEIGDKMRKMPENQINSLDTKMASQANSCEGGYEVKF